MNFIFKQNLFLILILLLILSIVQSYHLKISSISIKYGKILSYPFNKQFNQLTQCQCHSEKSQITLEKNSYENPSNHGHGEFEDWINDAYQIDDVDTDFQNDSTSISTNSALNILQQVSTNSLINNSTINSTIIRPEGYWDGWSEEAPYFGNNLCLIHS